jgi:HSP20 family protein
LSSIKLSTSQAVVRAAAAGLRGTLESLANGTLANLIWLNTGFFGPTKIAKHFQPMEDLDMAEATKVPVKTEEKASVRASARSAWQPFEGLRREVDRLFDDFDRGLWRSPFRSSTFDVEPFWPRQIATWSTAPAVDIAEKDNAFEVTAELPGIDEKNVEVKLVNGNLTIKGEKKEEKEEKKKDYYLSERHFGSFERSFTVPEGVDTDKIEASFNKGVLTVRLPKKPETIKPEKKIEVKTAA